MHLPQIEKQTSAIEFSFIFFFFCIFDDEITTRFSSFHLSLQARITTKGKRILAVTWIVKTIHGGSYYSKAGFQAIHLSPKLG